jgi:transposase InsO family protein
LGSWTDCRTLDGKRPVAERGRSQYCLKLVHLADTKLYDSTLFTDDYSRYGYVYLLKHKHEVFETFKMFKAEVDLQLGKKIKALRSDRGGEYLSQEFIDYLTKEGIVQHLTSPYTPQQNGVSHSCVWTSYPNIYRIFTILRLSILANHFLERTFDL